MMIGDAGKIDHMLASAAASDADVRFAGLSRAIDDAAKYGERKRGMDMLKPLLKRLNSADDIKALSCAAWARHDSYSARANAKRFQRSEERRVGKEGVRTCRYRWWPYH